MWASFVSPILHHRVTNFTYHFPPSWWWCHSASPEESERWCHWIDIFKWIKYWYLMLISYLNVGKWSSYVLFKLTLSLNEWCLSNSQNDTFFSLIRFGISWLWKSVDQWSLKRYVIRPQSDPHNLFAAHCEVKIWDKCLLL